MGSKKAPDGATDVTDGHSKVFLIIDVKSDLQAAAQRDRTSVDTRGAIAVVA